MTRDYKTSRRKSPAKKRRRIQRTVLRRKGTPGWVWLLCGLGLGLVIAIGAYFIARPGNTGNKPTTQHAEKKKDDKQTTTAVPDSGKPSRFDFYTLLPKMEVVIPDSVIEQANRALPQHEINQAYVLQTGSFRDQADAETMKAKLALLGIEADIETVVINDHDTWHRVRLGPFPDVAAMKPVRRQLKQHDINFILLKMKMKE